MRILVTGSRTWTDQRRVWIALGAAAATRWHFEALTIVHGGASAGADLHAARWVAAVNEVDITAEVHRADWAQHGRRAGLLRNAVMVELGADQCLAFVAPCLLPDCSRPRPHDTHGAAHCVALAEQAGIRTVVYRPEDAT